MESTERLLPPELREHVLSMTPLVTLKDKDLSQIGARHMTRWFVITLQSGTDVKRFLTNIKKLDEVEIAEIAPEPAPPP